MAVQVVRQGRAFTGGVIPDGLPTTVGDRFVCRVHMFDVPAEVRECAAYALGDLSGGTWWTVAEFRYAGQDVWDTAVARRVGAQIQYGIEKEG
jgi:hypothetical protein